jgi:hypothetical protein
VPIDSLSNLLSTIISALSIIIKEGKKAEGKRRDGRGERKKRKEKGEEGGVGRGRYQTKCQGLYLTLPIPLL